MPAAASHEVVSIACLMIDGQIRKALRPRLHRQLRTGRPMRLALVSR